MKTFETEKGNIPDGATHYSDECENYHFTWFAEFTGGEIYLFSNSTKEWKLSLFNRELKPIPQTNIEAPEERDVEWVSGNIAIYEGKQALIIAYHPNHPSVVIEMPDNEYLNVLASELSKPETEAERVERERLEAAEDLYTTYMSKWEFSQDWEALDEINKSAFLAIVDKTNYRKDSE